MFKTIADKIPSDSDYPVRRQTINVLTRILDGKFYDHLPHSFHTETNPAGEYAPLRDRRPSVKYALCRTVVDDSVSLVFSEGHFPDIDCADETVRGKLADAIKESKINEIMLDAATKGSVGSVAIQFRVLDGRMFFDARSTEFLTPVYDPQAPDTLIKIVERYKVRGEDLVAAGYNIKSDEHKTEFWMHTEWDADNETWFIPYLVRPDKPITPRIDKKHSVNHALGFVPWVWVKNLPGGDDIDGRSTFADAIDTSIEVDYLLSQGGRGLKYASDPTLLIKEPAFSDGTITKGAGNAIKVSADGDAKLLEINGTASAALIDYVKFLRELAIESIHGNRMGADKIAAAQSGRAMEIMNAALINLADKLRLSYGEGALLSLLKMIVAASNKYPIKVDGGDLGKLNAKEKITLRWPAWYAPTAEDRMNTSTTLKTATEGGFLSKETAVNTIAADYDVEDVPAELALIAKEAIEQRKTDQAFKGRQAET